ncbi:MAG: ankyrin repeat domain-containing protein [Candidatus Anstonellales archaeon]
MQKNENVKKSDLKKQLLRQFFPDLNPLIEKRLLNEFEDQNKEFFGKKSANNHNRLSIADSELFRKIVMLIKKEEKIGFSDTNFTMLMKELATSLELITSNRGNNLLHYFVLNNDLYAVKFLIDSGFNPHLTNMTLENALFIAINNDVDNRIIEYLIQSYPKLLFDLNLYNVNAYELAYQKNSFNYVKLVIETFCKANNLTIEESGLIDYMFISEKSPLHYAVESNNLTLVEYLLANKAKVIIFDNYKRIPLHYACITGNSKILELLLLNAPTKKDVFFQDRGKQTPIELALQNLNDERINNVLEIFIKLRKNNTINFIHGNYGSLLHLCIVYNNPKALEFILENYYNYFKKYINMPVNEYYITPLTLAIANNNYKIASVLLKYGANIKVKDNKKNTLLHLAAKLNNIDICKLLIENGIDVNATNVYGDTADKMTNSEEIKRLFAFVRSFTRKVN